MIKSFAFIAFIGTCHSAIADTCPEIINNMDEKDQLYADLLAAPTEMAGVGFNNELWEMWITAPDARAQDLMDSGRERTRVADYDKAVDYFTDLIAYCPHYAEGWNQRAYVHFLSLNYDASLEDISKTLEIEPRHFGALAGRATVLISMGRTEVGYVALREALALNPWLSERHLLPAHSSQSEDI